MTITVSTDGSALGNPNGPMGWGWADHELATGGKPGHHHDSDCDAGGATNGTNQIGELCAVLEALRAHPGSEPLDRKSTRLNSSHRSQSRMPSSA